MPTWTSETVTQIRVHLNFTWDDKARIETALTDYETNYTSAAVTEMMTDLTSLDAYKKTLDEARQDERSSLKSLESFQQVKREWFEGIDHESGIVGLYNELRAKIQRELELAGLRSNRVSVSKVVRG